MEVRYFGWSGVALRHGVTAVGFGLSGHAATWAGLPDAAATVLCVTHGHPDHCGFCWRPATHGWR